MDQTRNLPLNPEMWLELGLTGITCELTVVINDQPIIVPLYDSRLLATITVELMRHGSNNLAALQALRFQELNPVDICQQFIRNPNLASIILANLLVAITPTTTLRKYIQQCSTNPNGLQIPNCYPTELQIHEPNITTSYSAPDLQISNPYSIPKYPVSNKRRRTSDGSGDTVGRLIQGFQKRCRRKVYVEFSGDDVQNITDNPMLPAASRIQVQIMLDAKAFGGLSDGGRGKGCAIYSIQCTNDTGRELFKSGNFKNEDDIVEL